MHLFLRKPSRVIKSLLNVLAFERRISSEYFLDAGPVSNLPDNDGYGNTHSPNTGATAHDIGVESDTFKHV